MATEDVTKLPQWTQRRLSKLEADVEHFRAKLSAGPEGSDTFADPYGSAPRPLGDSPTIRFVCSRFDDGDPRETIDAHVIHDADGTALVRVTANAGNLIVRPGASNTIYLACA